MKAKNNSGNNQYLAQAESKVSDPDKAEGFPVGLKADQAQTEPSLKKDDEKSARLATTPQHVLYAKTAAGATLGVVSDSEPSSLTLLAAGVAGMAARRARRERAKKQFT